MTERVLGSADCPANGWQLTALLDGELSGAERLDVEEHLRGCARCAALLEDQRAGRAALRAAAPRLATPPALRARVSAGLDRAEVASGRKRLAVLGGIAAALALIALVSLLRVQSSSATSRLLAAVAATHRQQTLGVDPVSFQSSDPAAVAAWTRSASGHGIDIPSLAQDGYQLLGARSESSIASDAVTLVYTGPAGRITCTVLPASQPATTETSSSPATLVFHQAQIDGASVAGWAEPDATYVLAAALPPTALLRLARLAAAQQ